MQITLFILSFLLLVNTAVLAIRKSFSLGLIILFLIACCLLIFAIFWEQWRKISNAGMGYIIKQSIIALLMFFSFMAGYIMIFSCLPPNTNADVVIVPGSGVNQDGSPSASAKNRLDKCIEYCQSTNVKAIIVSGASGKNSTISEARSMKKYLVNHGITPDIIICDSKAKNTKQNFENAFILLQNSGISTRSSVYITNSFHCLRAGIYARQAGFKDISPVSTHTDIWVLLPAVMREICAVSALLFLGL